MLKIKKKKSNYAMVENFICKFVNKQLKVQLSPDELNVEPRWIGMDSLDEAELFIEIEKEFGIPIAGKDAPTGYTLRDLVDVIHQKLEEETKIRK